MTMSIYSILRQYGEIRQDQLAHSFAWRFDGRNRGYGKGAAALLKQIRKGEDWRTASHSSFGGQGSYGNGSGMRVAPLGAYFADDPKTVVAQARLSSEITHTHSEGVAGAIAIAIGAAFAVHYKGKTRPTRSEFIGGLLPFTPASEVKDKTQEAQSLPDGTSAREAAARLGNGKRVSCQDTVPFVLWSAGEFLHDYEEAFWQTASVGGDMDTTCAMVGGIVAAYTGTDHIPAKWIEYRESLPDWPFEDVNGS
jgi:ADP-ribosylglycohydrolase